MDALTGPDRTQATQALIAERLPVHLDTGFPQRHFIPVYIKGTGYMLHKGSAAPPAFGSSRTRSQQGRRVGVWL
jgi:hypothetical protein